MALKEKIAAPWFIRALKLTGIALAIVGGLIVALNLGVGFVPYGFALWALSSALWMIVGWVQNDLNLVAFQSIFFIVDVIGIVRWAAG